MFHHRLLILLIRGPSSDRCGNPIVFASFIITSCYSSRRKCSVRPQGFDKPFGALVWMTKIMKSTKNNLNRIWMEIICKLWLVMICKLSSDATARLHSDWSGSVASFSMQFYNNVLILMQYGVFSLDPCFRYFATEPGKKTQ